MVQLKTYAFLDSLQPQLASHIGTTSRGLLPVPYEASLFIEIAPGIAINQLMDTALKATKVRPAMLIVERAFGLLEVHHHEQGEVVSPFLIVLNFQRVKGRSLVLSQIKSFARLNQIMPC